MKVIIVSPSLDPTVNVSGISAVTQFIICNNKSVEYIHFELGRKDNEKGGFYRMVALIKSLKMWWSYLTKYPDAIIHYNFPLSKPSIIRDSIFLFLIRLKKKKFIIHLHGGVFLTASKIPFYLDIILKKIFSQNVPFIVLSSLEKNIVIKRYACKNVYVLPNCIDLSDAMEFVRIPNKDRTLVMGYIGRIAETKGMDYLIEACSIMKTKNIPFILKVAGVEEIKNKYISLFVEKLGMQFKYEGIVSGDEKSQYLKSLDIFILPSYFEGLPMSLLECMSFGVVPLTTNVGSIGEIVKNGINGLYIEKKDAESIVCQYSRLLDNRELLSKLSESARSSILNEFTSDNYVKELNQMYVKL